MTYLLSETIGNNYWCAFIKFYINEKKKKIVKILINLLKFGKSIRN
jgi:hypothetical protein